MTQTAAPSTQTTASPEQASTPPPGGRIQLALRVSDLGKAITFYSSLFGVEPAKVRDGYANFAISKPPLKLVLIEGSEGGTLDHLGVEVPDTDDVASAADRLSASGLVTLEESATACCYALQDKVWVSGPDGERWEVYTVLADSDTMHKVQEDDQTKGATVNDDQCCGDDCCG